MWRWEGEELGEKDDQPSFPGVRCGSPTEKRILSGTAWNTEGLLILKLGQKTGLGCRWGGRDSLYSSGKLLNLQGVECPEAFLVFIPATSGRILGNYQTFLPSPTR